MAGSDVNLLLEAIDRAYDAKSWHGPNLLSAIRRVEAATAVWRPGPGRFNIWEHVVHAAYWKYVARRRLTGEKRGSFPIKGSNWFVRPATRGNTDEAAWQADRRLLQEMHESLREAISRAKPADLARTTKINQMSNASALLGAAAHDVYHAGQIQLIKRLAQSQAATASPSEPHARTAASKATDGTERTRPSSRSKPAVRTTPAAATATSKTAAISKPDAHPRLNREWHLANKMPPKATLDQRIAWHVAHREHCGCREITGKLSAQMQERGLA